MTITLTVALGVFLAVFGFAAHPRWDAVFDLRLSYRTTSGYFAVVIFGLLVVYLLQVLDRGGWPL